MEQRISLVTLGVNDLAKSTAFFETAGLAPIGQTGAGRLVFPVRRRRHIALSAIEIGGGRRSSRPMGAGLAASRSPTTRARNWMSTPSLDGGDIRRGDAL